MANHLFLIVIWPTRRTFCLLLCTSGRVVGLQCSISIPAIHVFFKQKAHVFIVNSDDVYLSHQYICIGHNPQCSHAPRNEINASRRQREAAFEKGEADKMLKIKVLVLRDGSGAVAGDIPPLVGLCWAGWLYDICVDVRACVLP